MIDKSRSVNFYKKSTIRLFTILYRVVSPFFSPGTQIVIDNQMVLAFNENSTTIPAQYEGNVEIYEPAG